MKKILIILLIFPMICTAQLRELVHNGVVLKTSVNEALVISTVDLVINDYINRNPHYTPGFKQEINSVLRVLLSPNYTMPDASTNYYNTYISKNGQGRIDSDWFYVFKMDGNITTRTNVKSGATMKWHMGDSIYNQTNTPAHTYTSEQDYVFLTSVDDFTGITEFNIGTNNFYDEICFFDFVNVQNFYLQSNSFTGNLSQYAEYIKDWVDLRRFWLNVNEFSGSLDTWSLLSSCTMMLDFRIQNNNFYGDISSWSSFSTWTSIDRFYIGGNNFYGDISSWSSFNTWTGILDFRLNINNFTADISSWSALSTWTSCQFFIISDNNFYGDISSWSTLSAMNAMVLFSILNNNFTADIGNWAFTWPNVTDFYIAGNNFTGVNYIPTTAMDDFDCYDNDIVLTDVDALFSNYDTYFTSNTPVKNLVIDISGGTNASPTGGASNTNIVNLQTTFTNAGYTFTAVIN